MKSWKERQLVVSAMLDIAIKMQNAIFDDEEILDKLESEWRDLKRQLDQLDSIPNLYLFCPSCNAEVEPNTEAKLCTDCQILMSRGDEEKPYSQLDYERASSQGLNLDDWNDYTRYFEIGEESERK